MYRGSVSGGVLFRFWITGFETRYRGINLGSAWDEIGNSGFSLFFTDSEDLRNLLPWDDENCTSEPP